MLYINLSLNDQVVTIVLCTAILHPSLQLVAVHSDVIVQQWHTITTGCQDKSRTDCYHQPYLKSLHFNYIPMHV